MLLSIIGPLTLAYYVPPLLQSWPAGAEIGRPGKVSALDRPEPRATVTRCGDGDTCTLSNGDKVRLLDIDAPELGGARCANERVMAEKARDRLAGLVVGKRVELRGPGGRDKYDRILADVIVDGRNAGSILMAERLAVRWRPGLGKERPGPWC
ncbi:thermonuclease family protein [Hansschlegelia beijingensis]